MRFISTSSDLRMKDFCENFDAIDQPRAGPIEVGRAVDGVRLYSPARQELCAPVFLDCAFEREPARHQNNDVGLGFENPFNGDPLGFSSRFPENFTATGDLDHFRNPVSAGKWRIEPFHGIDPRMWQFANT